MGSGSRKLTKIKSYPASFERMSISQSLDSQISHLQHLHNIHNPNHNGSNSSSNSNLPEFNKRPLTDTPIVSSMASPITRDQSSDEDSDTDLEDKSSNPLLRSKISKALKPDAKDKEESEDNDRPIFRTKNISHLNLTDLGEAPKLDKSNSISPMTSNSQDPSKQPKSLEQQAKEKQIPDIKLPDQKSEPILNINKETREEILHDVPLKLQQEFEKTPSLEQLKNLLLTKPPPSARKAYTLNIPGQTSSKTSPDGKIASVDVGSKLVIVMVGLPARGKSYITNKLTRYLNWLQHDCRVFNVGNTRRLDKENNAGPETNPLPDTHTPNNEVMTNPSSPSTEKSKADSLGEAIGSPTQHNADFFNPNNKNSTAIREKWAMDTLDQLLNYVIDGPGSVGIFDATNSTKHRRLKVLKRIQQRSNGELKVLYLESICSDPSIIESNIRLKLSGPDYKNMDPEVALKDFVGRLKNYEKAYETIDELEEKIPGFQYVKMINVGKKVVSYNIQGFLASQTIYFLLNFNLCERQIWITRHGESTDNLNGRIGGNANLTKRGEKFSKTLALFMNFQRQEFRKQQLERFSTRLELKYNKLIGKEDDQSKNANDAIDDIPSEPNFCVWTSMLIRAIDTGNYFNEQLYSIKQMRMLNELGGGKFEGMTYKEIQSRYPKEFDSRLRNKLSYRYPGVGGESYLDVLTRLRPLITEIERTTDHLLIISHRVVLRILLAYFLNLDKSSIGELDVPLHTLYCLESKPYGTDYRMYEYDEHLDWFVKVEPEHQKNMKEVGVLFRERKYSVVPTAPPSSRKARTKTFSESSDDHPQHGGGIGNFSLRRSLSFGSRQGNNNPHHNTNNNSTFIADNPVITEDPLGSEGLLKNSMSSKKLADLQRLRKP